MGGVTIRGDKERSKQTRKSNKESKDRGWKMGLKWEGCENFKYESKNQPGNNSKSWRIGYL